MNPLRNLAGQTAVYGLSSIIGRVLNYLLTPLLTRIFSPSEYGVNIELYTYVSLIIIVLTYGMETAFFRFSQTEPDKDRVYSTSLISILISSAGFAVALLSLSQVIANKLGYPDRPEYVVWFTLIIAMDAVSQIPFARLREQGKAEKFALFRLINILVNIGFMLFFLVYCPYILKNGSGTHLALIQKVYNPEVGIGYVFISNLIASVVTIIMLLPGMVSVKWTFDGELWRRMIHYAIPLLIAGLAGMTNETIDRVLLKYLLPESIRMRELGIYGACYKISMMMTIFIQAFRFAAEPFFFAQSKEKNSKKTYADVMKYFVIIGSLIFLVIMLYIDIVKYFVGEEFHEGIRVVPILLIANLFFGIFFNLSIWYKLSGKTRFAALLTVIGAIITIGLNFWLIPIISYMGSAWATLVCYVTITVLSYLIGQKYFPVKYNMRKILFYIFFALVLYAISKLAEPENSSLKFAVNSLWLMLYMLVVFILERPKKNLKLAELKTYRR